MSASTPALPGAWQPILRASCKLRCSPPPARPPIIRPAIPGARGDAVGAATLFGAGDKHLVMQKAPFMNRGYDPAIAAAKEALGADRYEELYEQGARLSIAEATEVLVS